MTKYMRIAASDEERVANKIGDLFSDFLLDLESIGYNLSRVLPKVIFDRVMTTFDAADFYRQGGDLDEFNKQNWGDTE